MPPRPLHISCEKCLCATEERKKERSRGQKARLESGARPQLSAHVCALLHSRQQQKQQYVCPPFSSSFFFSFHIMKPLIDVTAVAGAGHTHALVAVVSPFLFFFFFFFFFSFFSVAMMMSPPSLSLSFAAVTHFSFFSNSHFTMTACIIKTGFQRCAEE